MKCAELYYRCKNQTGEGVTWLPEKQLLLWVDIDNGRLYCCRMDRDEVSIHSFPDMITSVIPWKGHEDEVLLTMKNRIVAFHLKHGGYRTVCELPDLHPLWRTNDCKAAPDGRLWCGIMNMQTHDGNGFLLRIDPDLSIAKVLPNQSIPNGMVWSSDGSRMYYADSGRSCIEEYAYDGSTGSIRYLRRAVEVPAEYGVPDGMTIDRDGRLWVAHWGGSGVYIWNPATGKLEDRISVPAPNVASCTFGGENRLFITTALDGLSEEAVSNHPLSGSLFVADVQGVEPGENHYPFVTLKDPSAL